MNEIEFTVVVLVILGMFGCLIITDICKYTYSYMKYQKLSFIEAIKQTIKDYIGTQY